MEIKKLIKFSWYNFFNHPLAEKDNFNKQMDLYNGLKFGILAQ